MNAATLEDDLSPMQATPAEQKRGMRNAIITQMVSAAGNITFDSGLMLLYLTKMGFADRSIILLLSTKTVLMMLLSIPTAYWCDRIGLRPMSVVGIIIGFVSFAGITLSASLPEPMDRWVVALSMIGFSSGIAVFNSGWFPLLKGFVPTAITGRFFGLLRFSWQAVALGCVVAYSLFLESDSALWLFQVVLGVILVGQAAKLFFFLRIPTFDKSSLASGSLLNAIKEVLPTPQFIPFCAYCFLLTLFTTAMPMLFNLVEKKHLSLGDNTIAMLGAATMAGAVMGYSLGGWVVDRYGTKVVFAIAHMGFMMTACLFPLRGLLSIPPVVYFVGIHVVWGLLYAFSSVALSTELFAVMPQKNRSLATAIWWTLISGGGAMSALLAAGAVSLGFLNESWQLFGHGVSQYDALILIYGIITGLMAVTLGLVPSVIGQPKWLPRGSS